MNSFEEIFARIRPLSFVLIPFADKCSVVKLLSESFPSFTTFVLFLCESSAALALDESTPETLTPVTNKEAAKSKPNNFFPYFLINTTLPFSVLLLS